VEEPVGDQQQHGDRNQARDRLEPLAGAGERVDQGAGDDPGEDRGEQTEQRAEQDRTPQPPAGC